MKKAQSLEAQKRKLEKEEERLSDLASRIEEMAKDLEAKNSGLIQERQKSFTATPIEDLELSVRSYNCLKRVCIDTVEDLENYVREHKDEERFGLMRIRNLGRKSCEEVVSVIKKWGLLFDVA